MELTPTIPLEQHLARKQQKEPSSRAAIFLDWLGWQGTTVWPNNYNKHGHVPPWWQSISSSILSNLTFWYQLHSFTLMHWSLSTIYIRRKHWKASFKTEFRNSQLHFKTTADEQRRVYHKVTSAQKRAEALRATTAYHVTASAGKETEKCLRASGFKRSDSVATGVRIVTLLCQLTRTRETSSARGCSGQPGLCSVQISIK